MEDLICPECGRPNLGEAKKCWYCQTELVRPSSNEGGNLSESDVDHQNLDADALQEVEPDQEETREENIPEWLLKVRERIEADRDPEEELPYWKQKDIFGGEKRITDKSTKEKKEHGAKKANQPKLDMDADNEYGPPAKANGKNMDEDLPPESENLDEIDDLSDELPDGFTKL